MTALRFAGRALQYTRLLRLSLDETLLLDWARQKTQLDDFGDTAFREPLRILLECCEREASLNLLGRISTRFEIRQLLVNRLQLVAARKRWPEIAAQAIEQPLFIVGLPRSGTTLLQGLLAQDPANRTPLIWETMLVPAVDSNRIVHNDRLRATAARRLRWFNRLAPDFRRIHDVQPQLPQECIAITAHTFASSQFHTTYRIPTYQKWLEGYDHRPCYAFQRQFLQHLQYGADASHCVLKAPAHLFDLEALFAEYPDACVVQTHRDPVKVLASVASLTAELYSVFSDSINHDEIGNEVAQRWSLGVERGMQARTALSPVSRQFFDVQYMDLVRDPVGTVQRIYTHFGRPFGAEARSRMQQYLSANPEARHGSHDYRLVDWGLDAARENERFRRYREFFGVVAEVAK